MSEVIWGVQDWVIVGAFLLGPAVVLAVWTFRILKAKKDHPNE